MTAGSLSIAGVAAADTVTPRSLDELAETVGALHADRKTFAFVGGGTHLDLGNAPRALDAVVRTVALDAVVDYAPEDQTITVEAGTTLGELDLVLARNGQILPLDAADRSRATVGGMVAADVSGRRRLRYGTAKDLIVGVGIVRPDGVRARGGGKVVKNVAGFDLPKLMVGSLGTLGAIATVTFRLYPIPESTRAVALTFRDPERIAQAARALLDAQLDPESVALYNDDTLVVTFAGTDAGTRAQVATVLDRVARGAHDARELSSLERESYEQRERAVRRDGVWHVTIAAPPSLPVAALAREQPVPALAVPVAYPLVGIALHAFADGLDVAALRETVRERSRGRANVVVTKMPDEARGRVDAWGPPPPSFALMRAVKQQFDPDGLCNPGRFLGGL